MADQFSYFQTAKGDCIASLFTHIVFGIIFIYLLGIPVQAFIMHIDLSQAAFMSLAYVPGDLIKATVSAFLAIKITQALSLSDTIFTKGG